MIDGAAEPSEVGLLRHHGAELFPVFELIIGGALPVAAAASLARLRSTANRLTGGGAPEGANGATVDAARARHRSKVGAPGHQVEAPPPRL